MRKLIVVTFLIVTICASPDFENSKDQLVKKTTNAPIEDILKKFVSELKTTVVTDANWNDYVDKVFESVDDLVIHSGLDPVKLSDGNHKFSWKILLITYHGEIDLTHGLLFNLSSMHRGGDVRVTSDNKYLVVTLLIAFEDLQFTYDYKAKFMGLRPSGRIQGKIANIEAEVKSRFDVKNLVASIDDVNITHLGRIKVEFSGNILVDWMLKYVFVPIVTPFLKPLILLRIEDFIRGGLDDIVTAINDDLNHS